MTRGWSSQMAPLWRRAPWPPLNAVHSPARICQASCKLRNSLARQHAQAVLHTVWTGRPGCNVCPSLHRTCLKAVSAGQWNLGFSPARARSAQAPLFSSCGSAKFMERVRNFCHGL